MTGKHEIIVKNRRIQYKFTIERNITILRGDSATGKTTLIDMIAAYQRDKENSGVALKCDKSCIVLTELNWKLILQQITDSIVFIDEGSPFVSTEDFAKTIKNSDNYYVIATRTSLFNLPYSVKEIYGIKNSAGNRYQGTKRIYSSFYPLYNTNINEFPKPDCVITEDSNSGFQFFTEICKDYSINCISAQGKSNIYKKIIECNAETILVIADGAAFGPEIEKIEALRKTKNLIIYLPESFEWIILKSELINDVAEMLDNPADYIESKSFFSWERFFTDFLTTKTKDTYLKYNKSNLNKAYLQKHEKEHILNAMPEIKF